MSSKRSPACPTSFRRARSLSEAFCTVALALGLSLPGAAALAGDPKVETLSPAGGVVALADARGAGNGIAEPPGDVVVVTGDGGRHRLVRRDGGFALDPAGPPPPREVRPGMLPDGIVTHGDGEVRSAWLTRPTERYRHGILGDAIEAAGLALERADGTVLEYRLDAGSVFEDRLVRLVDLDRDGRDEAVVVRSYLDRGAALAVFSLAGDTVRRVAEVPPIGRSNRWLNPAGAADYDGDGTVELAWVETPHIGGALRLYELRDGRLVADHFMPGFSNHAIGTREQRLSATLDWNGDGVADLAVPDARRRSLRIIGFSGGAPRELANVAHAAPIATAILVAPPWRDGRSALVYGLADGTLVAVHP
jgi:hypothetical protein